MSRCTQGDEVGARRWGRLRWAVALVAIGAVPLSGAPVGAQGSTPALVPARETVFTAPGLGHAVSVFGNTVIAGGTEAVEAYARRAAGWEHTATLRAADGTPGDRFGAAVDMRGSVALIGAPGATVDGLPGAGAAYVFQVLPDGTWVPRARLVSPAPSPGGHFGASLRNSGEINYIVGAPGAGSATIFEPVANSFQWTVAAQLTAPDLTPDTGSAAQFGASSALDIGVGLAAVGAPGADRTGAVYTYRHVESGWVFDRKLVDSPRVAGGRFGQRTTLESTTLLVGSPGARAATGIGVDLATGTYTVLARDLGGPGFGDAVGTGDAKGVAGDPTVRAAYLYGRQDAQAALLGTLLPSAGPANDGFGASVDADEAAVVGAPGADAVHIFDLTTSDVLDHLSVTLGRALPYTADGDVYGAFTVVRGPDGEVAAVTGRGRVAPAMTTPAPPFIAVDLHQLGHSHVLRGTVTVRDPGAGFVHTLSVTTGVRPLGATRLDGTGVGVVSSARGPHVVSVRWTLDDLARPTRSVSDLDP